MINIYIADVLPSGDIMPYFSDYRKGKLSKILNNDKLYQSATAERLLCYAAKKENISLPLDIKVADNGKPHTDGICFSISHSGNKVLVAVANEEIGADIQKICRNQNMNVVKKFLTPDEAENIGVDTFFELFARKESYFKMTGEGLPFSPKAFKSFKKCYFKSFSENDYVVAVCTGSKQDINIENVSAKSLAEI